MESTPIGLQWNKPISNLDKKQEIAVAVAQRAKDGQVIGAGSGSTAFLTVQAIGLRAKREGLHVLIVPSSIEIMLAAQAVGLPLVPAVPASIDWCFDGADEVDPQNRLIKGRGGALYKEKVIFRASKEIVVVADDTKSVGRLGEKFPVPVEVDSYCIAHAWERMMAMPHVESAALRLALQKDGPVITEEGRAIIDVKMKEISPADEQSLLQIAGVVETGIFSGFDFERISNV